MCSVCLVYVHIFHLYTVCTRSRAAGKLNAPPAPKGSGVKSEQLTVHVTAEEHKRDLKTQGTCIYMYV